MDIAEGDYLHRGRKHALAVTIAFFVNPRTPRSRCSGLRAITLLPATAVGAGAHGIRFALMGVLGNFAFVLVRPLQAGNVGSAARALKNMGLGDLRVVAPGAAAGGREACAMTVHGGDVLRGARRYEQLGAALADCTLAVGTTCRPGLYRSGVVQLREAAAQLASEAAANRIAIIFGPE